MRGVRIALPFDQQCRLSGLPVPTPEHRFHPVRRWRFDWAFVDHYVAIEKDGGVFIGGRHTRGAGFAKDMEKLNAAAVLGWRVLRFTPKQLDGGEAIEAIRLALGI